MYDRILEMAGGLSLADKRALVAALKAAIARELGSQGAGAPERCPHCGCASIVRKGHDRSGGQRWLRECCGRTFGEATRGLLAESKLPPETWAAYVDGMVAGMTLRELRRVCGVSLKTSWFMRMRVCEVMESRLAAPRSGKGVLWQVDGTYLDESLAGNRERARDKMPRKAHRHGGATHEPGISNARVCVVCGASDLGDSFCVLADRGRPTDGAVREAMSPAAGAGRLATDGHRAYEKAAAALGVGAHAVYKSGTPEAGEGLGLVDALHQRLKLFLARFYGVSTRRLNRYLSWFLWTEQTRRADELVSDTIEAQAATGRYRHSRAETFAEPQPFWDYWEGRVATEPAA